ncbi:MAG TPA: sensor domain-containing diguanylate cyclase, partial [Gemmatirosa sp.]|nr:sensor domain-containing diguanylate cyclase [Gemmatirosa sp.]
MSSPSLAAADQAPSRPPARSHARLLAEVLDHLPHAVLAVDGDWRIAMANARALGVLGRPRDAIVGTSLWALLPDLAESEVGRCCRQAAAERRPRAVDGAIPGLRGRFRIHATPVRAGGLVLHVRDVTAEHRIETEASHVAHRDPLTGVANRRHFAERLSHTVARRRVAAGGTARDRSAVLLFDVDGFAALNATRGHDAGDRLLQLVAERLGRAARGTDTVARVGPDEFAVLLDEVAADEELAAGARLLGLLDAPFALDEEAGEPAEGGSPVAIRITACVGVVPVDGTADADAVVRHAGIALQRARAAGPARLAAFTAELQAE